MVSPIAIALALSFWASTNGGVNPCPAGVQVGAVPAAAVAIGADGQATLGAGCSIQLAPAAYTYPIPRLCALIAHELGHSLYGLEHQDGTIMDPNTDTRPIPGVCYPPRRAHIRPSVGKRR